MYWFKPRVLLGMVLLVIAGCGPGAKSDDGVPKYFDIKKYFNDEAVRLTKQYPKITKTVSYNGQDETKEVTIKHWTQEFSSFIESDINKPAWRDSYVQKEEHDYAVSFIASDTTLHTRKIEIFFQPGHDLTVEKIEITNFTKNMLYQTREALAYIPDSIYIIKKDQKVRLLGSNDYKITGKFR